MCLLLSVGTHSNYVSVGTGQHPSSLMVVLLLWFHAHPNFTCVQCVDDNPASNAVVVHQHPSRFHIQNCWFTTLQIHICCSEPTSIQIVRAFCWISSQPAFNSECFQSLAILWCANAHVDAPIIINLYSCWRAKSHVLRILAVG